MFEKSSVGTVRLEKKLEQLGEDIKKSCWFFKENFLIETVPHQIKTY